MIRMTRDNFERIAVLVSSDLAKLELSFQGAKMPQDVLPGKFYPTAGRCSRDGDIHFIDEAGDKNHVGPGNLDHVTVMVNGQGFDLTEEVISQKFKETVAAKNRWLSLGLEIFNASHEFKQGDLITFKPGMSDRRFPAEGEAVIVTRVLPTPLTPADLGEKTESSSAYACARYDIIVAVRTPGGTFTEFYADSRRYEPFVD